MTSQVDTLLSHFARGKTITRLEAMFEYNIQNITARICDIRAMGFEVHAEMKKDAKGADYARYYVTEVERRLMQADIDRRNNRSKG